MTSYKPIRPADRASRLKVQQTLKMARSAHAYVRGSTVRFYEWLEQQKRGTLPEGPPIWICGDCHAGNLGPLADAEGNVRVQIRDLDQTVIGNPAHDLIRLARLEPAGRDSGRDDGSDDGRLSGRAAIEGRSARHAQDHSPGDAPIRA